MLLFPTAAGYGQESGKVSRAAESPCTDGGDCLQRLSLWLEKWQHILLLIMTGIEFIIMEDDVSCCEQWLTLHCLRWAHVCVPPCFPAVPPLFKVCVTHTSCSPLQPVLLSGKMPPWTNMFLTFVTRVWQFFPFSKEINTWTHFALFQRK